MILPMTFSVTSLLAAALKDEIRAVLNEAAINNFFTCYSLTYEMITLNNELPNNKQGVIENYNKSGKQHGQLSKITFTQKKHLTHHCCK